jgi:Flp pilus assembly pilin Flp
MPDKRRSRDERGMTTAEYAVGTVASCGFAGVLVKLLNEPWVQGLFKNLFESTIGKYF